MSNGPWLSGGKVFDRCVRCKRIVRIDKPIVGSMHTCVTDCQIAGKHLKPRTETRGWWIFATTWHLCGHCGTERKAD